MLDKCSCCGSVLDDDIDFLSTVQVVMAEGEEGYANITQAFCDEGECEGHPDLTCLEFVIAVLRDHLGFVDHRHGGINFLESDCTQECGYGGEKDKADRLALETQGTVYK